MKIGYFLKGIFILAMAYLFVGLMLVCFLLFKYSATNISAVEGPKYILDLEYLKFEERDTKTAFNTYYPTFNHFGSRNLFEVTGSENNTVALLGDSFFFGFGLTDEETIAYFLNQFDPGRKYINLALPGANIIDSVAIYHAKWQGMKAPELIIFQILYTNDICHSTLIEDTVIATVENDFKWVLPPFNLFFTKLGLGKFYYNRLYEKIDQDLDRERFEKYIREPLDELLGSIDRSKTRLIVFGDGYDLRFQEYRSWLEDYCIKNDVFLYHADELLSDEYLFSRLPDGHPSAQFNEELAKQFLKRIPSKTSLALMWLNIASTTKHDAGIKVIGDRKEKVH